MRSRPIIKRPMRWCGFWRDAGAEQWFRQDPRFDQRFRARFLGLHLAAARRERDDWLKTPESALALMILLDQFPRNAFRNTAHMYATDPLARRFARIAIAANYMQAVEPSLRLFFFLPAVRPLGKSRRSGSFRGAKRSTGAG
ncbi:DUF924 family protein [Serratia marcescens]|nr:DUF924 family protein [Serratia marcescens]